MQFCVYQICEWIHPLTLRPRLFGIYSIEEMCVNLNNSKSLRTHCHEQSSKPLIQQMPLPDLELAECKSNPPAKRNTYNLSIASPKRWHLAFPGAPFGVNHIFMISGSLHEFRNPEIYASCRIPRLWSHTGWLKSESKILGGVSNKFHAVWVPAHARDQTVFDFWISGFDCRRTFGFSKTLSLWLPHDFLRNDAGDLRGEKSDFKIQKLRGIPFDICQSAKLIWYMLVKDSYIVNILMNKMSGFWLPRGRIG